MNAAWCTQVHSASILILYFVCTSYTNSCLIVIKICIDWNRVHQQYQNDSTINHSRSFGLYSRAINALFFFDKCDHDVLDKNGLLWTVLFYYHPIMAAWFTNNCCHWHFNWNVPLNTRFLFLDHMPYLLLSWFKMCDLRLTKNAS